MKNGNKNRSNKPWGLKWRSSVWFATLIVGIGIGVDLLVYSIIIPVVPFQLQVLGYKNVAALSAYLLLSFSVGLIISTPPISWLSERYSSRRAPFIIGLLALVGFLVMFMEAKSFWVMLVARFLQGISSSTVWVIGLALLCDTTPEERAGQQLGLAMMGHTIGFLVAPPIGGALYDRFGFRAPFIFGMVVVAFDFIGRLLFIERKDAIVWEAADAAAAPALNSPAPNEVPPSAEDKQVDTVTPAQETDPSIGRIEMSILKSDASFKGAQRYTSFDVLKALLTSSRTNAAVICITIYGIAFTALEPTLPLRLQDIYNFDAGKAGLVFLAIAIPATISTPTSGWASDRYGVEVIVVSSFILSIPWLMLLIIRSHLALFVVSLAVSSFFVTAVISPLTAELAHITLTHDGIGYGHVYGAFNLAYGIGSAAGPIIGGQIYDNSRHGWTIVVSVISFVLLIASITAVCFVGERPMIKRVLGIGRTRCLKPAVVGKVQTPDV